MRGMSSRDNSQGPARAGEDEVLTAARVARLERELAELRGRRPGVDLPAENPSTPPPDRRRQVRRTTPVRPS
jgi:hypothetical protein